MYLPCNISRDFKKCEHVNLRGEWTRVIFEELYYAANNQKIADKKKANYQEALEKSRADSATRSRDSYMKGPEKIRAQSCESYMWPDFRKPTKLSHLVFREIPILNIQATVVPLC